MENEGQRCALITGKLLEASVSPTEGLTLKDPNSVTNYT